jgi:hypothetical protein
MQKMTKAEALAEFRQMWRDLCEHSPQWKGDSIAKREEFNNYTDTLCKERRITPNQYNTWSNPF